MIAAVITEHPSGSAPPPPRRPTAKALLVATLLGVAGAGFGYWFGQRAAGLPWLRQHFEALEAVDLLLLPVLILLVLAVHEVGHLLGGFSRGMRFLLLIVGPCQWTRSPSGIRFKWVFNLGTMGGIAAATPDPVAPLTPQLQRLVLGGPLASLVLAVLGLAMAFVLDGRAGAYGVVIGAMSFMIFLVTAAPLRAGGFMSDGMQFLELRRGGAGVAERQVLVRLMGVSYGGIRPRDWEPQLVQDALAMQSVEPLRRIAGRTFALYQAMDCGDTERLREHADWLARHVDDYPDGFRQSITLELCLVASQRGDLEAAREWWKRSRGGVVDAARRALAEASLAALEGDVARLERALVAGRRALPRGMDPGINQLTADQLDAVAGRDRSRPPAVDSA
jgi:hypothetical protein